MRDSCFRLTICFNGSWEDNGKQEDQKQNAQNTISPNVC